MSKLWRCMGESCTEDPLGRLGFDFQGPLPVCPKCKSDARRPEFRQLILQVQTIHFAFPDPAGPVVTTAGRRRIACQPDRTHTKDIRTTAAPDAVTCPACRQAPTWQERFAELGDTQDAFGVMVETDKAT